MRIKTVLLGIVLLLAACTGTDTVKIGFLGPLSGDTADLGQPAQKAVELAIDQVNEEGGVNGKEVEVIFEDTKCSGKESTKAIRRLINVEDVQTIVGGLCSAATQPAYEVAEQNGVPMMAYGSTTPDLTGDTPLFYRTIPSDSLQAQVAANVTVEQGHDSIAVFHVNDAYGTAFQDEYVTNLEQLGGTATTVQSYTPGDTDFQTQLERIQQSNPDAIYLIAFPREGRLILQQQQEMGLDQPVLATEVMKDPDVASQHGSEGLTITYPQSGEGTAGYDAFTQAYQQRFGEEPPSYTREAYDAFTLTVEALRNCDDVTACWDEVDGHEGASGTLTFDRYGDVVKEYDIFTVRNGSFVKE